MDYAIKKHVCIVGSQKMEDAVNAWNKNMHLKPTYWFALLPFEESDMHSAKKSVLRYLRDKNPDIVLIDEHYKKLFPPVRQREENVGIITVSSLYDDVLKEEYGKGLKILHLGRALGNDVGYQLDRLFTP